MGSEKLTISKNGKYLGDTRGNNYQDYDDLPGDQIWFSYDGSRIFLNNGVTLYASDDDNDMQPHGDFNTSHEQYYYNYFSQSSIPLLAFKLISIAQSITTPGPI